MDALTPIQAQLDLVIPGQKLITLDQPILDLDITTQGLAQIQDPVTPDLLQIQEAQ